MIINTAAQYTREWEKMFVATYFPNQKQPRHTAKQPRHTDKSLHVFSVPNFLYLLLLALLPAIIRVLAAGLGGPQLLPLLLGQLFAGLVIIQRRAVLAGRVLQDVRRQLVDLEGKRCQKNR